MRKFIICMVLICTAWMHADDQVLQDSVMHDVVHRSPNTQSPGLLAPSYAITIRATDFRSGPVVIKEPGYYVLTQDVVFDPSCPHTNNLQGKAWGAAVIILAENVVLDLNTRSIQQKRTDFDEDAPSSYYSKNFKVIQLGGRDPYSLTDATVYAPSSITIKNGTIANSQAYGIYGQNNSDIDIYDVTVTNCDRTAIYLENLQCSRLKQLSIIGSLDATGNAYGVYLRDNSSTSPSWTTPADGTSGPSAVVLDSISVCDVYTNSSYDPLLDVSEWVACINTDSSETDLQKAVAGSGVTAGLVAPGQAVVTALQTLHTQVDATVAALANEDKSDEQKLVFLQDTQTAIITVQTAIAAFNTAYAGVTTPTAADVTLLQSVTWFTTIMQEALTLINNAIYVFDIGGKDYVDGSLTTAAWHSYGIRVVNGSGITCKNCSIIGTSVDLEVAAVTRAVGYGFDACDGLTLKNCLANTSSVYLGSAIGYSITTNSIGNFVHEALSTDHTSDDKAYGFWLRRAYAHRIIDCEASSNKAVSESKGFVFEYNDAHIIERCKSYNHSCTIVDPEDAAQAIGFDCIAGNCHTIRYCEAYNMHADTGYSNIEYQENMLAAGFRLRSYPDTHDLTLGTVVDYNNDCVISHCLSRAHEGAGGNGVGILLNGAVCVKVTENEVATAGAHIADSLNPGQYIITGHGYGIWDTAADTSALIVKNMAYANQTANYKVSYSLSNEALPIVESSYGDMTSLFTASEWENISLYANPGTAGCMGACTVVPEFFE